MRRRPGFLLWLLGGLLAGCGGTPTDGFLPAEPGLVWRYRIALETMNFRREERQVVRNERRWTEGEALLLLRRVGHERLDRLRADGTGWTRLEREVHGDPPETIPAALVLPADPVPGREWRVTTRTEVLETTVDPFRRRYRVREPVELTLRIEAVDAEVRTPAGRYTACLRVRGHGQGHFEGDKTVRGAAIEVQETQWWARGVGLVRREREETTGNTLLPRGRYLQELEAFETTR